MMMMMMMIIIMLLQRRYLWGRFNDNISSNRVAVYQTGAGAKTTQT